MTFKQYFQIMKYTAAHDFLMDQGFQEETLALLNEDNLYKLANEYGWEIK